jgi:hypothetical protein
VPRQPSNTLGLASRRRHRLLAGVYQSVRGQLADYADLLVGLGAFDRCEAPRDTGRVRSAGCRPSEILLEVRVRIEDASVRSKVEQCLTQGGTTILAADEGGDRRQGSAWCARL